MQLVCLFVCCELLEDGEEDGVVVGEEVGGVVGVEYVEGQSRSFHLALLQQLLDLG